MNGTMTLTDAISGCMIRSGFFSFPWRYWSGLLEHRLEAVGREVPVPRIVFAYPVEPGKSTCQSMNVFPSQWETVFTPRTELGRKLYALRNKAVAAGMKLLSEEDVLEEAKRRRGEIGENETDLC